MTRSSSEEVRRLLAAVGEVLRSIRRGCDLHQEQVGALAGVAGNRVGEVERGTVNPSIGRIAIIANVLGVPISVVLRHAEMAMLDENKLDEIRSRVVALLRKLAPADLDLVAAFVARLAVRP